MQRIRQRVKALSDKIKTYDPEAWCMLICTVFGHIQLVLATKKDGANCWPYTTFDIADDDPEWESKLILGFDAIESTIDDLIAGTNK